ncbi:DoxX family membrane protein [Pseudoroseicyclus sp. H15]
MSHGLTGPARDGALLAARLLLAGLFLGGAVQKITDPAAAQELLAMRGWPLWFIWPALAYNAATGLALLAGAWITPVALSLAAYCIVTSYFHFLPDDPWQMTIFVKNWAIAGGCLALAAAGPGNWRVGA